MAIKLDLDKTKSYYSLSISIGIHILLLILLGGVVIIPGYMATTNFMMQINDQQEDIPLPPELPEEITMEETGGGGTGGSDEDPLAIPNNVLHPVENDIGLDLITSQVTTSSFVMPTASIQTGIGDAMSSGSAGSGGGSGGGHGTGIGKGVGKGLFTGTIGGVKVQASSLAVILDSSGSMRNAIPDVVEIVAKSFPTAYVAAAEMATLQSTLRLDAGIASSLVLPIKKGDKGSQKKINDILTKSLEQNKVAMGFYVDHILNGGYDIDAIYFYTDFKAGKDGNSLQVVELMEKAYAERGIKVFVAQHASDDMKPEQYLKSIESQPDRQTWLKRLYDLAQSSGGSVKIGPIIFDSKDKKH